MGRIKVLKLAACFLMTAALGHAQTQNYVAKFNSTGSTTNSSIFDNGNVGIGTTSPSGSLTVANFFDNKITTQQAGQTFDLIGTYYGWNPTAVYLAGYNSTNDSALSQTTRVIVGGSGSNLPLEITGALAVDGTANSTFNGNVGVGTTSPGAKLEVNGNVKLTSGSGASLTFADGTTQSTAWTGALCGGDYAESVGVAGERNRYEPGDVLVIDTSHPTGFIKSSEAYSSAIAGIYSTKPGAVGRRTADPEAIKAEIPMAMVGIVPTKVSAENGPIHRGDLLVTASTPGRAMKGTDRMKMTGAIVGKALGDLETGVGVIDVLVSLQ